MKTLILFLVFAFQSVSSIAQINIEEYKKFLSSHANMTYDELLDEYPAGRFLEESPVKSDSMKYYPQTMNYLNITPYEKSLLDKNGFMVTARSTDYSFISGYFHLYNADLPVYISADAILNAMHYSFNKSYQYIEEHAFYYRLIDIVKLLKNEIQYYFQLSKDTIYIQSIKDFDVYLTVAENLLLKIDNEAPDELLSEPYFNDDRAEVIKILNNINSLSVVKDRLFSSTPRQIVFSEFKPRGHYTDTEILKAYFRAMMWFGYIEIVLNNPENVIPEEKMSELDLRRQTLLSVLISAAAKKSKANEKINAMEKFLTSLVGPQDNLTIMDIDEVLEKYGINNPVQFANQDWSAFLRNKVTEIHTAKQIYSSQILTRDIMNPNPVKPSTAFKLFGQRPVIDGYITYQVVYDRIKYDNQEIFRGLPKTLDILFALKNDAAIQLLEDEISKYQYSSNLAGLRYLINSFDDKFWGSSNYNIWLNAIMQLNPPRDREHLPKFMQTAAWWQKTMTTQLASWSQLRHDFLLSVKKPYSAGDMCSYPDGYIEPVPDLYRSIKSFAGKLKEIVQYYDLYYSYYFPKLGCVLNIYNTMDNLIDISEKELAGVKLDSNDLKFINRMIGDGSGCLKTLGGWYPSLYFGYEDFQLTGKNVFESTSDITVADVHTQPTDNGGNLIGYSLQCGTGYPNVAVIAHNNTLYTGYVYSYFEDISKDFNFYTDADWKSKVDSKSLTAPFFTNLYMANSKGAYQGEQFSLWTYKEISAISDFEDGLISISPNPANDFIEINVPRWRGQGVDFRIYDILGMEITTPSLCVTPPYQGGEIVRIYVSHFSPGIYFVRMGDIVRKFIKI